MIHSLRNCRGPTGKFQSPNGFIENFDPGKPAKDVKRFETFHYDNITHHCKIIVLYLTSIRDQIRRIEAPTDLLMSTNEKKSNMAACKQMALLQVPGKHQHQLRSGCLLGHIL